MVCALVVARFGKKSARGTQMGNVVHLAVDRDRAGSAAKPIDDASRMRQFSFAGGERCVDDRYLIGVNCDASGKPVVSGRFRRSAQAIQVFQINVDCVERFGPEGVRSE
jgi:hypothetical protein